IAAGNDDTEQHGFDLSQKPVYPACSSFVEGGVIVVGATDTEGKRAQFSPYGSCIDVMAPGTNIFSTHVVQYERVGFDTFYGGGWSGTSLATAMVTGTIALMRAVNPELTPEEIEALVYAYCDPIISPDSSF
ncbi:MAG: S8 family serine peptidase, partial [Patescibacteria group bacterium]